ncbi:hypothetical protein ACFMB7_29110 [Bacillus toyonensis]
MSKAKPTNSEFIAMVAMHNLKSKTYYVTVNEANVYVKWGESKNRALLTKECPVYLVSLEPFKYIYDKKALYNLRQIKKSQHHPRRAPRK